MVTEADARRLHVAQWALVSETTRRELHQLALEAALTWEPDEGEALVDWRIHRIRLLDVPLNSWECSCGWARGHTARTEEQAKWLHHEDWQGFDAIQRATMNKSAGRQRRRG